MWMRRAMGLTALVIALLLAARPSPDLKARGPADAPAGDVPTCRLQLELTDRATGQTLPGVVRLRDESGQRVSPPELLPRGLGVPEELGIHDWYLLPTATEITVPRGKLTISGFFGLETELGEVTLDLREQDRARCQIPLTRFFNARKRGWQSANTHVHLQKLSRPESERYLLEVARADRLDIVYISYLERAEADLEYTTNKYSLDDLRQLSRRSHEGPAHAADHEREHEESEDQEHSHDHAADGAEPRGFASGTEFDNGEEHRHNFTGFEEGYGHVMLLHLAELILPASIGPGITLQGLDSPPLRQGIEAARAQGSTIIWCHNQWGLEDVPNWLAGKLHANNIFDGGTHGSYQHSFYRYLNAGLKVPFSTGTDWFIYDFSRVYVLAGKELVDNERQLSSADWLERLARGRNFISNGPLLDFTVDGHDPGDTLELSQPGPLHISATATGRLDFQRMECVRNGVVVASAPSQAVAGHFEAKLELDLEIDQPCWLALRTPPPSAPREAQFQQATPLNEYGRELFSHTSAVYVNLAGRGVFDVMAAQDLLEEMKSSLEFIRGRAAFGGDAERDAVLGVYLEGIQELQRRIDAAGRR